MLFPMTVSLQMHLFSGFIVFVFFVMHIIRQGSRPSRATSATSSKKESASKYSRLRDDADRKAINDAVRDNNIHGRAKPPVPNYLEKPARLTQASRMEQTRWFLKLVLIQNSVLGFFVSITRAE